MQLKRIIIQSISHLSHGLQLRQSPIFIWSWDIHVDMQRDISTNMFKKAGLCDMTDNDDVI